MSLVRVRADERGQGNQAIRFSVHSVHLVSRAQNRRSRGSRWVTWREVWVRGGSGTGSQHAAPLPSVAMVPPPWSIMSPAGVIHVVADDKALRALAKANPEVIVGTSQTNKLRDLVGKLVKVADE